MCRKFWPLIVFLLNLWITYCLISLSYFHLLGVFTQLLTRSWRASSRVFAKWLRPLSQAISPRHTLVRNYLYVLLRVFAIYALIVLSFIITPICSIEKRVNSWNLPRLPRASTPTTHHDDVYSTKLWQCMRSTTNPPPPPPPRHPCLLSIFPSRQSTLSIWLSNRAWASHHRLRQRRTRQPTFQPSWSRLVPSSYALFSGMLCQMALLFPAICPYWNRPMQLAGI